MNEKKLQQVFRAYIDKFDFITYEPHYEIDKWVIAHEFRPLMDQALEAEPDEIHAKMKDIVKLAGNLLTNQHELPGDAICSYVELEPERMRAALKNLFAEDNGELNKRQKKIDAFINECGNLKEHYYPDSYKYAVGQRAAMVLLGLYDPEQHYLYKPLQATTFADIAEFYDDFGPATHFNLPVYYRMCDELVSAIRANEELMAKHRSRYDSPKKPLHEDKNLRILAFDVIYSGTTHKIYDGIPQGHITQKARQEYFENCKKAEELADAVDRAQSKVDRFHEALAYYSGLFTEGATVKHKTFGIGTVTRLEILPKYLYIHIEFPESQKTIRTNLATLLNEGLLKSDAEGFTEKNAIYKTYLSSESSQREEALKNAIAALRPYEKYLR